MADDDNKIPTAESIYQRYLGPTPKDRKGRDYIFAGDPAHRDVPVGVPDHFRLVEAVHGDVEAPRNENTGQHEDDVALAIDEACCDAIRLWEEGDASKQLFGKQQPGRDR